MLKLRTSCSARNSASGFWLATGAFSPDTVKDDRESVCRIGANQRQPAQREIGAGRVAGTHLDVESRLVQIERDALRSQLNGRVAIGRHGERRRREPAAQFDRLVQIAIGWEEKRVAGKRLRQKARRNLTLFLKDDIEERAAVDRLRNGCAQNGIREGAGIGDLKRKQLHRRRTQSP